MYAVYNAEPSRQLIFFSTGAFAGVCSACADFTFDRASSAIRGTSPRSITHLARSMTPHLIKPGIRFWGFDVARTFLLTDTLPVSAKGGLSGAFGGFLEMLSTNLYHAVKERSSGKSFPIGTAARTITTHSCKLFLCFGSYTYLANTFSETLPPQPFAYCLLLGALAGAFGTTLVTPLEMYTSTHLPLRASQVIKTALTRAPRGAVGVGTVIAVQVTSSAQLLQRQGAQ